MINASIYNNLKLVKSGETTVRKIGGRAGSECMLNKGKPDGKSRLLRNGYRFGSLLIGAFVNFDSMDHADGDKLQDEYCVG